MTTNYNYADNGVGCNTFESSALMKLLDARDAYLKHDPDAVGTYPAMNKLCQAYCQALSECAVEWEDYRVAKDAEAAEDGMETDEKDPEPSTGAEALELLRLVYALTQLSGVFLILPGKKGPKDMVGAAAGGSTDMVMYEDKMSMPGAVTADTVRFLRRHALGAADDPDEFDPAAVDEMRDSVQPDQYDGGDIYWKMVENLMIRGCLEEAWVMLSNHSMLTRSLEMEEEHDESMDDYLQKSLEQDREGFELLRRILLSAPIPGGRNNDSDGGFPEDAVGSTGPIVDEELIEGIPSSGYRLWDTTESDQYSSEYSLHFEPYVAHQLWETWRQAIKLSPELQRLRNRIPQLSKLMDLLSGDFRQIQFSKWSEELCCELLYKNPDIHLVDMCAMTERVMENDGNAISKNLDKGVVRIMNGNAGEVIKLAHQLGGNSGAALPAVVVSGMM